MFKYFYLVKHVIVLLIILRLLYLEPNHLQYILECIGGLLLLIPVDAIHNINFNESISDD